MTEQAAAQVADAITNPPVADAPVANMGDLKRAVEAREAAKKERDAALAEVKAMKEAQMTEQQKLAARVAELEPQVKKAERYEAVIGALLESELATVPEEMRDLVPSTLATEERLDWLRQAKAKGLFAAPVADAGAKKTDSPLGTKPGAQGNVIKRSAWEHLPPMAQADFVSSGGKVID